MDDFNNNSVNPINTPAQPVAPAQPAAPATPTAPTQPAAPAQPAQPAKPVAPFQPTAPVQPVAPQPTAPAQPVQQYPQQPAYQPVYQQPVVYAPQEDKTSKVMSVGEYIGMTILLSIPVVNIICWIVWLVSPSTNKNKKNYLIAQLVIVLIVIVLTLIVFGIMAATGASFIDELEYYL